MVTAFRCALELSSPATSGLPPRVVAACDTYHEMMFVVEAGTDFRHSLDKAGITSIFSADQPLHSPLQTTLQMNYRLTIVGGRYITAFCAVAPVHSNGHAITHFPPPAALSPLEPLAGSYMLLISQSKSRLRGHHTIPNLAPLLLVTLVTRLDHAAETPEGYTTL